MLSLLSTRYKKKQSAVTADVEIEIFAERRVMFVGIDILAPSIKELMQAIGNKSNQ